MFDLFPFSLSSILRFYERLKETVNHVTPETIWFPQVKIIFKWPCHVLHVIVILYVIYRRPDISTEYYRKGSLCSCDTSWWMIETTKTRHPTDPFISTCMHSYFYLSQGTVDYDYDQVANQFSLLRGCLCDCTTTKLVIMHFMENGNKKSQRAEGEWTWAVEILVNWMMKYDSLNQSTL